MSKLIKSQHDKFFRKAFGKKENAKNLMEEYLPREMSAPINLEEMHPLPNNDFGMGLDEHITDLRFFAPTKDGNSEAMAMILTEHKSYQDNNVSFQVGFDLFVGWRTWWIFKGKPNLRIHPLPGPILILLYNGKEPFNFFRFRDLVTKIQGLEMFVPDFEIWVIDLSKIPSDGITGTSFTRANLLALKYGGEGTITEHLSDIFANYNNVLLDDEVRANVQDIVEYAHSTNNDLNINQIEHALEKVFPESEIKIMTSVMLKDIEARGEARGKAEGEVKGKVETLLRVLTRRFGNISELIQEKLYSIQDIERLDRLVDVAIDCQTLDEFENHLVK
jgi:hypothetical protein